MGNNNSTSTIAEATIKTFRLKVRNDTSSVADVLVKAHDSLEKTNLKRKRIPPKTIVSLRMPTTFQDLVVSAATRERRDRMLVNGEEKLVLEIDEGDEIHRANKKEVTY